MKRILFICGLFLTTSLSAQTASDYFNKANDLRELGQFNDALKYYDQALTLEKASPSAEHFINAIYLEKGICLYTGGKYAQSIESFSAAVSGDPHEFSKAFQMRAKAKLKQGDEAGALADFSKSVQHQPQDQVSFFERAMIYKKQGKLSEACSDFQSSAQLGNIVARQEAAKICK